MFKIKLLILFFLSFLFIACVQKPPLNQTQYSISYIDGERDGLNLKNILIQNLKLINLYNKNSIYKIESQFSHKQELYITNIDKTTDREKITTNIKFKIIDQQNNCVAYQKEFETSQFYVFASSNKFLSNKVALEKIKYGNTEYIVKKLIPQLVDQQWKCN